MGILIGFMMISGLVFVAMMIFFIYVAFTTIDEVIDIIRYRNFKSGKSNVAPKYFCRYNWNN